MDRRCYSRHTWSNTFYGNERNDGLIDATRARRVLPSPIEYHTTFVGLPLARATTEANGAVRVDGIDVREYVVEALREEVAVVEQNPYLFSGTVAENVAYGDRRALADEWDSNPAFRKRIVEAAKAAEAHEFVEALPEGYDTTVGERGLKLSGGQRQRIAIARALLSDPVIIVFDEATSDVDTETEELIQESIDRLIAELTAFVIAHRLSTIKDADRVVVVEDGELVESGTHEGLLRTGGDYATLWEAQADEDRPRTVADD